MLEDEPAPRRPQDEFALHFIQNQSRVYAYIATLLPNRSDAEEILQRTSLVMWQKWDRFDPKYGFVPWARGIALNEIRNFLRRSDRKNVHLSDSLVSVLASDVEREPEADRVFALKKCLGQLDGRQKDLLEQCYLESLGAKEVASSRGVSVDAIYMRVHRIRRTLMQCVQKNLSGGMEPAGDFKG
jgi:RNA polymerase sigma-70 factor (ECF subfamily)